jgi:ribosomal protein S18 acetylase RimI-like enzyme
VWGATMPNEYRALGSMVITHASLYRLLQKQGIDRVTGYVRQQNKPAWKMMRGLGFKIISELVTLRVLKWRIARCTPYTEA